MSKNRKRNLLTPLKRKEEKKKKKDVIFFCDIDGTLIKGEMDIPDSVIFEAKKFMNKGGVLCLCTGRAPISLGKIMDQLQANGPCIIYSGSAGYDFRVKRYLWCNYFDKKIKSKIKLLLSNYPTISVQVYTKEKIYLLRNSEFLQEKGVKEECFQLDASIQDIERCDCIIKIVLAHENTIILQRCQESLFMDSKYNFEFSSRHFVEILPENSCKENGAMKAIEILGLLNPFVLSAGDGKTDQALLQNSDISFAPKDGMKSVIEHATYTIQTCQKGGLTEAFALASECIKKY